MRKEELELEVELSS